MPLKLHPQPSKQEQAIRNKARAFVDEKIRPTAVADDESARFRKEVIHELGSLGLTGMVIPVEYGGQAMPYQCYLAGLEELARGSLAMAITVAVTHLSQGCLLAFGNESQKKEFLPPLAAGKHLGAFSLSEPDAGSDAASLKCKATPTEGGYLLEGTKSWCTSGGYANTYIVMTRTGEGSKGISAFIVSDGCEGFSAGKQEKKLGLRSSPLSELAFEGCFIPEQLRLAQEGEGLSVALSQLDIGRMAIAACSIGIARDSLERAWRFHLARKEKGIPFPPGTKNRLAHHFASLQAVKSLLWEAAELKNQGQKVKILASESKLLASDLAMRITSDVVESFGQHGYIREFEVERQMRDAKALQIVEGTNQVQLLVISRELEGMMKR